MTLLRTQIREAMIKRLSTLDKLTIFDSPLYPLAMQDLPALCIRTEKESLLPEESSLGKDGMSVHTYALPVVIEGILQATQHVHRCCEDLALAIMDVLQTDLTLGGLCKTLVWESGVEITTASEGEEPVGKLRLVATVLYRAAENAPELSCD